MTIMITGIILFVTSVLMFIITIMELRRRVKEKRCRSNARIKIDITSDERRALKEDVLQALESYVKIEEGDITEEVELLLAAGCLAGLKYAYGKKESTRNDAAGTDDEEIEDDGYAANGNMQGLHV